MPAINEDNAKLLALYGITLIKENKSSVILKLKNNNIDSRMSRALYDKLLLAIKNRTIHIVKLPNITFGVELEFVGSRLQRDINNFNREMTVLLKDKYFNSGTYTHNDGHSWILGRDGSIKYDDSKLILPFGYELSSAKINLFNIDDITLLNNIIELAKKYLYAEVNKSCGTHIHIGFKRDKTFRGNISDMLSSYSYMESCIFDPIVPSNRRRNRYCNKTQPWLRNKYQKLSTRFCDFNYDGACKNLHFEFRQLEGTLDINTIIYWAKLQSYILYDLLDHIYEDSYRANLATMNIFDILFYYDFDSDMINFFIYRVINFKSRTIQATNCFYINND